MVNTFLLEATLQVAVPMWVEKIRAERWKWSRIVAECKQASEMICEKGDVLQFGGGKRGEVAAAFNALAMGLACMSFMPGGVKFQGMHFDNDP